MVEKMTCDRCGKQLKFSDCNVCDGEGYFREWLVFKTVCEVCSGSGKILRCPDEYKHIREDFKLSPKFRSDALYKNFQNRSLPRPPSSFNSRLAGKKPDKPNVPPPWHRNYPNPWHPMHPRNPNNQPFNPANRNSPFNPNNPLNRRLPGDPSTDPPDPKKK